MILDTNILIEKVKRKEEIKDNITIVSAIEFIEIIEYRKFYGKIYYPIEEDYILALKLQNLLRKRGKRKPFADLIIASICINRNEKLITKDRDFLDIKEAAEKLGLKFEVEIK